MLCTYALTHCPIKSIYFIFGSFLNKTLYVNSINKVYSIFFTIKWAGYA